MHVSDATWHDGIDDKIDTKLETAEGVEYGEHDWVHDIVMVREHQRQGSVERKGKTRYGICCHHRKHQNNSTICLIVHLISVM